MLLLFFATLALICLGCNSKKSVDAAESFVINTKFLDRTYLKQAERLEKCLYELQSHIYDRIELYKDRWVNYAISDVESILRSQGVSQFDLSNFAECFQVIAEHNANRFICRTFEILAGEEDMLHKYAVDEYQKCVAQKNRREKNPLIFEMPQIGVGGANNLP